MVLLLLANQSQMVDEAFRFIYFFILILCYFILFFQTEGQVLMERAGSQKKLLPVDIKMTYYMFTWHHISFCLIITLFLLLLPSVLICLLPLVGDLHDLQLWSNSVSSSGNNVPLKHSHVKSSPYDCWTDVSPSHVAFILTLYVPSHYWRPCSGNFPCGISMKHNNNQVVY